MKISYNWLKEFVNIPLSPEEVGGILTDIGLEVEKIEAVESIKGGLRNVKIGYVVEVEKHPDADRLRVTKVDVGAENLQTIVCGAANVAVGQKVIVALPGATLYPTNAENPIDIKISKIRGVESCGMICAEDEIGTGTSHDGIMVLESDAKIGQAAAEYFQLETDYVFEIGLTPNRADAMSHFGVARDLMAAFIFKGILPKDSKVCQHNVSAFETKKSEIKLSVNIEDTSAVRYAIVQINDIKISASPQWLQQRLKSIGVKTINNVVDVTNYVLHEMGQPLHAFDAKVVNGTIVVKKGMSSKFTTLDGVERTLDKEDLMICNASEPMCIAGVFGGSKSGVSESTTSIVLESAYFSPVSVRKSAKRHGLSTDASYRFERGIDPNVTIYALKRAALLIQEIAGGKIEGELFDHYPSPIANHFFDVSMNRIKQLCGISFTKDDVVAILNSLEISILEDKGDILSLEVPAYRVDVTREADIAEDILRIYGFNNVPIPDKLNSSIIIESGIDKEKVQNVVSDWLTANGLFEGMSNSLTSSKYHTDFTNKKIREDFNVALLNPLSSDLDVMRQSLLFGALEAVNRNQNYGNEDVKFYEFGKVYHNYNEKLEEESRLIVALSGNKNEEAWNSQHSQFNFFSLKGLVEGIFSKLGIFKNYQIQPSSNELFEDGITYSISKKEVATIGWVSKKNRNYFDIRNEVFIADINWKVVLELLVMNKVKFKELAKFPAVTRDFSLLLDKNIQFGAISSLANQAEKTLLKQVQLFDVYEGKNLPEGKKSYAVRFVLQDETKTLQDKQIEEAMKRIQDKICSELQAQLR
jgi:phenylalanyl-tRNA synthetase beta chain